MGCTYDNYYTSLASTVCTDQTSRRCNILCCRATNRMWVTPVSNYVIKIKSGADPNLASNKKTWEEQMFVSGKPSRSPQNCGNVAARLHAFMQAHDVGLEELADWLQTHPRTLAQWFNGTAMAPACSLISLPVISRLPEARVYPSQSKEEALRRVQAI